MTNVYRQNTAADGNSRRKKRDTRVNNNNNILTLLRRQDLSKLGLLTEWSKQVASHIFGRGKGQWDRGFFGWGRTMSKMMTDVDKCH